MRFPICFIDQELNNNTMKTLFIAAVLMLGALTSNCTKDVPPTPHPRENNKPGNQSHENNKPGRSPKVDKLMAQGLTEKEAMLYLLISEYRTSLGLPVLPLSKSLTEVARAHVKDSNANHPENQVNADGVKGNLHSWSAKGNWTPVIYTSDHKQAKGMWSKPSELTAYKGYGYEISVGGTDTLSPQMALNSWKGSPAHNSVILTSGDWNFLEVIGVGIDGDYAHVWFGKEADPAGYYTVD